MKKLILFLCSLALSIPATFSQSYSLSNPLDLAKLHNDCLNYIGAANAGSPNLGNPQGIESNRGYLVNFYNLQKLPISEIPSSIKVAEFITSVKTKSINEIVTSHGGSQSLASQLNALLTKCKNSKSISDLEEEVSSFLETINGSEKEVFVLRTAAYTAINSAKLWEEAARTDSHPFHSWAISSGPNSPGGEVVFERSGRRVRVKWWRLLGDVLGATCGILIGGGTPASIAGGAALGALVSGNIDEQP